MHVEYKVKLPDHDFVIAKQHKLVLSVIGDMETRCFHGCYARENKSILPQSFSRPTYSGIGSAKHLDSSAYSHLADMKWIREKTELERGFKKEKEKLGKTSYDSQCREGADENPRYEKTISCCTVDYCNTYDLDAFFLVTNQPERSTFSRVKRRMAPLCKELGGVFLEQKYFGAHLDEKGNTIDPQLELQNFRHTEKILGEICSGMVINVYPLITEYLGDES